MKNKKMITYTISLISIAVLLYMFFSKNEVISPIWIGIITIAVLNVVDRWGSKNQ